MDQWEKEIRKRLEDNLENGAYTIDVGDSADGERRIVMMTGKGGYINYQIEFEREARKTRNDMAHGSKI